ncbi:conserved oligomeric Golgi complex subunit 7 isoform X1 [Leguminivora glycinivorella]|uniref:conserved oligomeric Golgi complex subunit 7 isoform X1 n=2 Tax=Leguminivora glycinivorella TaxID=1035111 RepID=UPI0020103A53|nr:conserved oligomeric Golgi complex subunit 7 isoform X1 [Leguminivora glycinivorella]
MDLKTFGEDDFDPKKWINRAWSSSGNQEKEVFVANTVSRLQLYMKQLTNSLDETTTQIVNSIPRTLQDAAALQLEGAMLQQQLLSLGEKVEGVEEQTGHSILSLQRIDQLKSRLENAASALREADKWAALATALEDVLESGVPSKPEELEALAGQVTALTHSLEVLTEASDYESKRLQLEALYNRLEAALSAPFLTALDQGDKERTACYVSLFRGMNRAPSAARCWRRSVCTSLATQWRRAVGQPSPKIATLAGKGEAHTHVEWLTNVLKSETPYAELVRLYTDLLQSLDPSPTKVVSASLKLCSDPEEGILQLIELRRDIDEFLASIRAVIDEPAKNKEVVPPSTLQELGLAAYAPLKELLPKYTDLQRQVFLAYLEGSQLRQEDILEQSRAILTVAERCEGWLDAAYGKAKKIADEAVWPHYTPAVEAFFTALCALISSHSRRIEQEFQTSKGGVLSAACPASVTLERAAAQALEAAGKLQSSESDQPTHPLTDLPSLLLEPDIRSRLPTLVSEPPASAGGLRRAAQQLRALARAVVRGPVDQQLDKIPSLNVWNNNDALTTDLPDFSLSPQEYITEIGQYLMTLPQHLEMHLSEKQAPWQFLSEICTHTCEVYAEKILNIRNMDALGTKRCLTDIVYLSSVVEDLGTAVTPSLKNLERSLRVATPQSE